MDSHLRNELLSTKNYADKIPQQLAQSFEIASLLEWSVAQEGFYYLPTPPAVIMMYSTLDRENADAERLQLEAVFPKFKVTMQEYKNPTKQLMFDAIRYAQDQDEISALIVIIMSHGVQGSIEAADGHVRIQDILSTMCSPTLDGKPKVSVFLSTFLDLNMPIPIPYCIPYHTVVYISGNSAHYYLRYCAYLG